MLAVKLPTHSLNSDYVTVFGYFTLVPMDGCHYSTFGNNFRLL